MPQGSSRSSAPRIAIIGGGVIGLAIGWRLAPMCPVAIFERDRVGRGASWAAAGMLAAGLETEPGEERLLALTQASQRMWPDFAREVEAASGAPIGYREDGTIAVALNRDDAERLRFTYEFQRGLGIALDWLTGAQVRAREPHLANAVAGVFSASDHAVDNRLLVGALHTALLRSGGIVHENAEAGLVIEGGRVRGVHVDGRLVPADIVIVAAGAWSRAIDGLPEAARPPVRPIKGQMLALAMNADAPLLRHVVWAPKTYLVPRRDGRLVIGATVEERGFDTGITAGGLLALLEGAWRAVPAIEELPVLESWAGLRPGCRDDAPVIGPAPAEGLILATGHHRNGILLAPITAAAIAELVLSGRLPEAIRPFGLERFARAANARSPA
jgi:glycine oxidase